MRIAPKAGTIERYRLQEWLNFITAELHKQFSPLFNKTAAPEWKAGVTANITKRLEWLNKQLEGKARIQELARMLGGGDAALKHAQALLLTRTDNE